MSESKDLKENFHKYLEKSELAGKIGEVHYRETERAFMAGASVMHQLLTDELPVDEDEGILHIADLRTQCVLFWSNQIKHG